MQTKPIIGLCADRKMLGMHPFHAVGEKYINAVIHGAESFAVVLPSLGDAQSMEQTLDMVDGLLFTGSPSNVEPKHYAGAPSEPGTLHDPHRDATTLPMIKAAIERGIPVLGICRGFQEMNVVFGGTLFQKVHEVPGKMDHREKGDATLDEQYGPVHEVHIQSQGLLHKWFGQEKAMVNSIHQQGVDRLGEGLQIEATAPDGLIEAFSVRESKTFAFAVQWHPEWKHAENPLSTAIFKAFGAACRQRQQQR
ncbi:gamma-glutamyl-gamma-aminobutyrate hydrolase family protein [Leeia sp. TBRC 13508]|uniref:Gamma-glutamyl-gamma-aminobutyrate hydrolase family protein n=1 Tax=Leeia speluncae TaxID=2884804 RepID=A0ABS8D1Q5_9NEIS|nr:gamma-glutamyl-gamma-aminobutyrate hydrolase family protein [Leeia speluncae]MCB6182130.1 gamma-glutamyl-gamma-aminobutyrate hydrolase family protein [Leeia speluncae]